MCATSSFSHKWNPVLWFKVTQYFNQLASVIYCSAASENYIARSRYMFFTMFGYYIDGNLKLVATMKNCFKRWKHFCQFSFFRVTFFLFLKNPPAHKIFCFTIVRVSFFSFIRALPYFSFFINIFDSSPHYNCTHKNNNFTGRRLSVLFSYTYRT